MKVINFIILFILNSSIAQDTCYLESFKPRSFGRYFLADHYAPIPNISIGAIKMYPSYDIASSPRNNASVLTPILGAQLPLFNFYKKKHSLATSIPISFSVLFDYTELRTAPILNTDYRFALLEINYNYEINSKWLKNIGVKFIPLFHESTHVGDELTIAKTNDSLPGARVNVSYETYEIAFILNDPKKIISENNTFRIGAKFLWNPQKGYYSVDSTEKTKGIEIESSSRFIEPYFQYQYQTNKGFFSFKENTLFIISTDFNLRVKYGYPNREYDDNNKLIVKNETESYFLSTNILMGWKFKSKKEYSDMGAYIGLYYGINPHGQFRNIDNWTYLSFKLIYDIL